MNLKIQLKKGSNQQKSQFSFEMAELQRIKTETGNGLIISNY